MSKNTFRMGGGIAPQPWSAHPSSKLLGPIGLWCLSVGLAGCGGLVARPYTPPQVAMPDQWQHGTAARERAAQGAAAKESPAAITRRSTSGDEAKGAGAVPLSSSEVVSDPWWRAFGDTRLDALVAEALARNNDLAVAGFKVRQAQLNADLVAADLHPTVTAVQDSSGSRSLARRAPTQHSYTTTTAVSYEVDLWGRLAQARDAKVWEARATEQDRQSTRLALEATTVTLYWKLAYLNQRVSLAQASTAYAARTLALVEAQYGAGAASRLEVASARQTLASQQADETDLIQQREEARNALAILFDGAPNRRFDELTALPSAPLPTVQEGLPVSLLGRRPDLQAAELRLRESLATVNATRADYYPRFSLTGTLGTGSGVLGKVLSDPAGTLASELALPFLNWNQSRLQIKVKESAYEQAVAGFRQTLYSALQDVENALSARSQYEAKGARLQESLMAARDMEHLYEVRYRVGAAALKDWLSAQETRRQAEVAYATNHYNLYANRVTLFQVLGGS